MTMIKSLRALFGLTYRHPNKTAHLPPWSDLGRKLVAVHMADELDTPRKWWAALSGGAG